MGINQSLLQGNIAVLFGGSSSERDVSLKSGAAVLEAFAVLGQPVTAIDCHFQQLTEQLKAKQIKHCFNILHGGYGENGELQAVLDSMNISYTGSSVLGSALAMDKMRSKLVLQGAGISTAAFVVVNAQTQWQDICGKLGDKVMLKPASEGSSIGMSIVQNATEFTQALNHALKYDNNIIAEKWINGPEYTVAILNGRALPVIKLETDSAFYDYQAKYLSNETRYLCPCGLNQADEVAVQALALQAFEVLGCKGWGRVDVMRDSDGVFYVLEVNTAPGMTDHSLVPMAAKAAGLSFDALVKEIFEQSLM